MSLCDLLYLLGLLVHISTTKVATELRLVMSLLFRLGGCLRLLLLLICVIHKFTVLELVSSS